MQADVLQQVFARAVVVCPVPGDGGVPEWGAAGTLVRVETRFITEAVSDTI